MADKSDSEDPSTVLDHENLDVYKVSLDFVGRAYKITRKLPADVSDTADQLRRSSTSIVRSIAEGSGRGTPADQARFYRISLGSAKESGASLDILRETGEMSFQDHATGKMILNRIVSMLMGLVKKLDGSPGTRRKCGLCGK